MFGAIERCAWGHRDRGGQGPQEEASTENPGYSQAGGVAGRTWGW